MLFQQAVDDLIIENDTVVGVVTSLDVRFYAKAVVLTAGTFYQEKIHVGDQQHSAGRAGDPPSIALAQRLRALPFRVGRLKQVLRRALINAVLIMPYYLSNLVILLPCIFFYRS